MLKNILLVLGGFALCLVVMFAIALAPRWKALTMAWSDYKTHEKVVINTSYSLR